MKENLISMKSFIIFVLKNAQKNFFSVKLDQNFQKKITKKGFELKLNEIETQFELHSNHFTHF